MFRIKVASTALNLNDAGCSFTASTTIQVLSSLCTFLPAPQLTSFTGKAVNGLANLTWITSSEKTGLYFEIEKSTDAVHFQKKETITGVAKDGEGQTYLFTDNEPLTGITYYRIKLVTGTGYTYSHVVTLYAGNINFEIKSLLNPFDSYISFDAITATDGEAKISLFDGFGRLVSQKQEQLYKGLNKVMITGLGPLSEGSYFMRVQADGQVINKKIIKIKK